MRSHGQSSTEYTLLLSVIVIASVAAAFVFVPGFQNGTLAVAQDASQILTTGQIGGVGLARDGGGVGAGFTNYETDGRGGRGGGADMAPGFKDDSNNNGGVGYAGPLGPPGQSGGSPNNGGPGISNANPPNNGGRTGISPMGNGAGPSFSRTGVGN